MIGRGDAGEVLTVQTDLAQQHGVLKRPVQNVSGGTIVRQALKSKMKGRSSNSWMAWTINEVDPHAYAAAARRKHPGTSATGNLFMISEQVPGVSIENLLKTCSAEKEPSRQSWY